MIKQRAARGALTATLVAFGLQASAAPGLAQVQAIDPDAELNRDHCGRGGLWSGVRRLPGRRRAASGLQRHDSASELEQQFVALMPPRQILHARGDRPKSRQSIPIPHATG